MTLLERSTLRARHLCAMALLVCALPLATAGIASAHAALIFSDPVDSATAATGPQRVTATFNEPMQPAFAAMTVIGPDGAQWNDGEVAVEGPTVSVGVRPAAPAGSYTVNYRATSADGHVVTGAWSFTVTESPPAPVSSSTQAPAPASTSTAPVAAPATPADNGIPVWPFIVAASAIIAGGAVWAVRRRS